MKNHNSLSGRYIALRASLCLYLLATATCAKATDVQFSANFQAPTCQVSAPASLDFGDVSSSAIRQGDSLANPLTLTLTVSQCAGFVGAVQKPGVKVSGVGNTSMGDFLFLQPATTQAVNYGVHIATATGDVVNNNTVLPVLLSASNFDGGSVSIPLSVALSCGNKCADAATKGGTLNAAVTFDFAYQ